MFQTTNQNNHQPPFKISHNWPCLAAQLPTHRTKSRVAQARPRQSHGGHLPVDADAAKAHGVGAWGELLTGRDTEKCYRG